MLPTTPEFKTAIDSNVRQIAARARINFSDVLLDLTAAAELESTALATETGAILLAENGNQLNTELNVQSRTFPDQMVNGRRDATRKWASLDGSTTLDGTFFPAPSTVQAASFNEIGWWGQILSGPDGTFTPPQRASITFSPRALNRVDVVSDGRRDEYGVDYDILIFDNTDTLLTTVEVRGNTAFDHTEVVDVENAAKITLIISKWNRANRQAKITEISPIFEQLFESQDIVSFDVTEQRETGAQSNVPTGGITSNEADIVLINQGRIFDNNNPDSPFTGNIRQNARVFLELGVQTSPGEFEYVPVFNGWSGGWNVPDSEIEATTAARDRLELLSRSQFEGGEVQENNTFAQWFERVLNDAELSVTDYNIDIVLGTGNYIVPFGWIDKQSHRSALELLARGSGASVYVDRNGIIQIDSIEFLARTNRTPVKTFTRSDYTDKDNQPIYANLANEVVIRTQPHVARVAGVVYETPAGDPQTIPPNRTQTFTVFYNETPVINAVVSFVIVIPGVSITNTVIYSWGADVTVENTTNSTQSLQFQINGQVLDIGGGREVTFRDQASVNNNGLYSLEYDGGLFLQDTNLAQTISDILVRSFSNPQRDLTITFEPGGDPSLELNDMISVTDRYTTQSYNIVNTQLQYNGGLNVQHEGRIVGFTLVPLAAETGAILLTEDGAQLLGEEIN